MISFDVAAARKDGIPDAEIAQHLASLPESDISYDKAHADGIPDQEIIDHLIAPPVQPPIGPMPLVGPQPAPSPTFGQKVERVAAGIGKHLAQHRLKPLVAALTTPIGGGGSAGPLHDYVTKNGLEEKLTQGMSEDEALNQTIRDNLTDLTLTALDVGTLGSGAAIHQAFRQVAAKAGLKGLLGHLASGAAEAGSYGATYAGISGAIEGESAKNVAQDMAKDFGIGALIGLPLGAVGAGVEAIGRTAAKRAAETGRISKVARKAEEERQIAAKAKQEITQSVEAAEARRVAPPEGPSESIGPVNAPEVAASEDIDSDFERMASGAKPDLPIVERARSVPYHGTPELRPYVRAQEKEPLTLKERWTQFLNTWPKAAFTAEPGAKKPVADAFLKARYGLETAPERANQIIADRIVSKLQGDVGSKSAILSDYMAGLDRVSRMKGLGQSGPGGTPIEQWEREVEMLAKPVRSNPDVHAAHNAVRNLADEMFTFMVDNGMIEPERYRANWTPTQQIVDMAGTLVKGIEDTKVGRRILSATEQAESAGTISRTNIIQLMRDSLEALLKKGHENELVNGFLNDPNVNVTSQFENGQPIPRGYKRWMATPGQAGWQGTDELSDAFYSASQGAAKKLGISGHAPGSYIFPEEVVNRLEEFYAPQTGKRVRQGVNAANAFSRALTLYSPTNRVLNQLGDFPVALMGLPGEKADPIGVLRFYPKALAAAYRGAFGANDPLYKRAVKEGIAGSTFIQSIGGKSAPHELEAALAQGDQPSFWERNIVHKAGELIRRERQAGEAAPRIAAGLAAEAKSGKASEFARTGRASTLAYGAGDPAIVRDGIARILAPFWRWQGLATERMLRMVGTKGSRARGWALLAGPPAAAATWNVHNDEFKKVEYSLPTYLRNQMHVILMDPKTGGVLRDENGNPRVWNTRFYLPDQVLSFFGLGNLPGRAADVVSGYTMPGEFVGETGSEMAKNIASLPAPLLALQQTLTGRSNLTGQQMEPLERVENVLPLPYLIAKTAETARNQGLASAAKELPERIIGVKTAGAKKGQMDAKLQSLLGQMRDAQIQMRSAAAKGNKVRTEHFRKKAEKLGKRISRLQKQAEQ